ncbi:166_t:CDS:1, partial [Acaulospora colombiana]
LDPIGYSWDNSVGETVFQTLIPKRSFLFNSYKWLFIPDPRL